MQAGVSVELLPSGAAPIFAPTKPPVDGGRRGPHQGGVVARRSFQEVHSEDQGVTEAGQERRGCPRSLCCGEKPSVGAGACGPHCAGTVAGRRAEGRCGCLRLADAGLTLVLPA